MEPIELDKGAEGIIPDEIQITELPFDGKIHTLKEPILLKYTRSYGEMRQDENGTLLEWEGGVVVFPQGYGAKVDFPKFLMKHAIVKLFSEQLVDSITTPEDNNHIFKSLLRQNYSHLQAEIGFNG